MRIFNISTSINIFDNCRAKSLSKIYRLVTAFCRSSHRLDFATILRIIIITRILVQTFLI